MNRLGKLLALSAIGFMSLGTTLEAQDVDPSASMVSRSIFLKRASNFPVQ